ncbi:MAG: sulfite reductase [Candidatus Aminicenantes bacterium RBG_13_63_10]|nr:MAG: sulfite reductase [Candidatus Aminicenantes bacterium RBG_13_63_10]
MPHIEVDGRTIELNEEGFLAHPEEWDKTIAGALAKSEEGLAELTPEHWAVIQFIRDYFLDKKMAPMVRKVCQASGFTLKHIYELFPSGPAKGACKLAGLPKPDGCV